MTEQSTNTRREFLKAGASLIGVSVVPYTFTARRASARESKNDRLSFAAIGVGGRGTQLAQQTQQFGDVVAVCDADRDRNALCRRARAAGTGGSSPHTSTHLPGIGTG